MLRLRHFRKMTSLMRSDRLSQKAIQKSSDLNQCLVAHQFPNTNYSVSVEAQHRRNNSHFLKLSSISKTLDRTELSLQQKHALRSILVRDIYGAIISGMESYSSEAELNQNLKAIDDRIKKNKISLRTVDSEVISELQNESIRLTSVIQRLRLQCLHRITGRKSQFKLELSVVKGKAREDIKSLALRIKRGVSETSTEASRMIARIESVLLDFYKTFFSLSCACGAFYLSYLRFTS